MNERPGMKTKAESKRWTHAAVAFASGLGFLVLGILFPGLWGPVGCLVCALVAMVNGGFVRGAFCLLFAFLAWPVIVVVH